MQAVFHLIYFSHAVEDIAFSDIQEILQSAREHNSRFGVTGLLIFREGYFVQLIEGSEKNVKEVLGKILLDERNYGLRVLAEFSTNERFFENWAMAYVDGDISVNETKELVKLCDEAAKQGQCAKKKLIEFLYSFRDSEPNLA